MDQRISKSSLSEEQIRLVELLQNLNFGRIEGLRVRGGAPIFEPPPRVVQTLKMGRLNGPREEIALQDFWLKQPVVELIQTLLEVGDGEILAITVMHGLPQTVEIQHHVQN